jgi:hypothetical protein
MTNYEVNQVWGGSQDVRHTTSHGSAEFKVAFWTQMDNPKQFTMLCLELPPLFHQGVLLEAAV